MAVLKLKSSIFPDGQLTVVSENLPASIGRSREADITIDDKLLSRKHSELRKNLAGNFVIVALDSTNLTIVNGRDVESHVLETGDTLLLGETEIFVDIQPDSADYIPTEEGPGSSTTADLTILPIDRDTVEND